MNNKFIVIEGLEGSGKSIMIKEIINILYKYNILNVIHIREPGSTPLAESIRKIIKNNNKYEYINKYTELLMLYAARVQLTETVIKPKLSSGYWIVSDRYDLSTQAYQGGGRGINHNILKFLRKITLGNFYPDLTLYLDIPPEIGIIRNKSCGNLDRIELESIDFFNRTRKRYQELAKKDNKIITIDASKSIIFVKNSIYDILTKWLKN